MGKLNVVCLAAVLGLVAHSAAAADNCGRRDGLKVSGWGNDWVYEHIDSMLTLTDAADQPTNNNGSFIDVHTGRNVRELRVCTHESGCVSFGPGQSSRIPLGGRFREVQVNVAWCLRS